MCESRNPRKSATYKLRRLPAMAMATLHWPDSEDKENWGSCFYMSCGGSLFARLHGSSQKPAHQTLFDDNHHGFFSLPEALWYTCIHTFLLSLSRSSCVLSCVLVLSRTEFLTIQISKYFIWDMAEELVDLFCDETIPQIASHYSFELKSTNSSRN